MFLWSYLAGMNNFDAFAVNFGTDGSNIRHFMFDCRLHPSGPFDLMDLKKRLKRLKNTHLAPSGPFLILYLLEFSGQYFFTHRYVITMYIKTNKQKSGPTFLESLPLERFGISVTMFQDLFATLINFCDWQEKS